MPIDDVTSCLSSLPHMKHRISLSLYHRDHCLEIDEEVISLHFCLNHKHEELAHEVAVNWSLHSEKIEASES